MTEHGPSSTAREVATPTVSVVVRSTDRPTLAAALASLAEQDYPTVEVVLVAASGATHPAPPARIGAHPVRFAASAVRLTRPQAANVGIDAASGDWISFLDDDDVLLPGHVAGLAAAAGRAQEARFTYTLARARMADGSTRTWGQPFSLQQLYERNFIHLASALFSRELVAQGCRFDDAFEIMQDWDFFLQCAQRTRFHFEPRETFEWRADAGTSGAAGDVNHDGARFAAFRDRIYAKWQEARDALVDRVTSELGDAAACARSGDLAEAETRCRAVLAFSQNDPFALNLLGMVLRSAGRLGDARAVQEQACAVRPADPSLHYNLALVCRQQGDLAATRREAERALRAAPGFVPARSLLAAIATSP
ncbi:MAG: glycosyltransferase [Casimicrobiaceae bacterium]